MSKNLKLKESLSALMDGEAGDLELRRILKELPNDSDLEQKWERYHLIRAVLQQEVHSSASVNILAGVRAQLADEPVYSGRDEQFELAGASTENISGNRKVSKLARTLSQLAIAASVALVVLYSANLMIAPTSVEPVQLVDTIEGPSLPLVFYLYPILVMLAFMLMAVSGSSS